MYDVRWWVMPDGQYRHYQGNTQILGVATWPFICGLLASPSTSGRSVQCGCSPGQPFFSWTLGHGMNQSNLLRMVSVSLGHWVSQRWQVVELGVIEHDMTGATAGNRYKGRFVWCNKAEQNIRILCHVRAIKAYFRFIIAKLWGYKHSQ